MMVSKASQEIDVIDVHHHPSPPADMLRLFAGRGIVAGPMLDWSLQRSFDDMGSRKVTKSMLSIPLPNDWFRDGDDSKDLIRTCNDFMALLVRENPEKFGLLIGLPLPDIEASLAEIARGYDKLKADGVCLLTNTGDKWLGDPAFAPILRELDRRKAVMLVHPVAPLCCLNLIENIPDRVVEFAADTARTIAQMIFSGSNAAYPDLKIIWSHGGGVMPYLVERYLRVAEYPDVKRRIPNGFLDAAGAYYYDTAQICNRASMAALTQIIPAERIVFGTDFPFFSSAESIDGLKNTNFLNGEQARLIFYENAARLFPHKGVPETRRPISA